MLWSHLYVLSVKSLDYKTNIGGNDTGFTSLSVVILLLLPLFYGSLVFVRDYPGEPVPERQNGEGKTNLDLLEQEIVIGFL